MEVWQGAKNPAWTFYKYRIDCLFPALPCHSSVLIWGENYKYWVLRKNSSVPSVAVVRISDSTVVLTSLST